MSKLWLMVEIQKMFRLYKLTHAVSLQVLQLIFLNGKKKSAKNGFSLILMQLQWPKLKQKKKQHMIKSLVKKMKIILTLKQINLILKY